MATITRGKTFISGETVEPADMHQLVDNATIAGIVNADIDANAAIAASKLALTGAITDTQLATGAVTADKVATGAVTGSPGGGKLAASAITGQTQLTDPLADGDEFLVHDTSASALRRVAYSSVKPLTFSTSQVSTSGTSIDFTGIPSWARRVTVIFDGVSLSGTSVFLIQLGDSGGIETTGYNSVGVQTTVNVGAGGGTSTSGFVFGNTINSASNAFGGLFVLSTLNAGTTWAGYGGFAGGERILTSSGSKTLSSTLDRVRITTVNGTDTFDAGTINIAYE